MIISHNNQKWQARILKSADLSTGFKVFLFQREVESPFTAQYVVAVKSPLDHTSEWITFERLNRACEFYLGMLACYA